MFNRTIAKYYGSVASISNTFRPNIKLNILCNLSIVHQAFSDVTWPGNLPHTFCSILPQSERQLARSKKLDPPNGTNDDSWFTSITSLLETSDLSHEITWLDWLITVNASSSPSLAICIQSGRWGFLNLAGVMFIATRELDYSSPVYSNLNMFSTII